MQIKDKFSKQPENELLECFQHSPQLKTSGQSNKLNEECKNAEQVSFDIKEQCRTAVKNLQSTNWEQERYKAIFESVNDIILVINKKGVIVDVNSKLRDISGYEKEEIIGKKIESFARMITKKSLPIVLENFRKRMAGIDVPAYEVEMVKSGGELLIFEIGARPLRQNGEIVGDLVTLRDITEVKKMESTLKDSEKKLRNYLESAPDGIYLSDLKGTFLYGNKEIEKITGYRTEELLGKNFLLMNILEKKDSARAAKLFTLHSIGEKTGPDEFQLVRKDGGHIWVEINSTPIKQDGQTVVLGFVRDITERNKVQQALYESESKFRILAEESPNMIFINKMGLIVYANKRCELLIGYKREELCSPEFDFFSLIAPECREQIEANFRDHMKGKESRLLEYTFMTKSGERIEAVLATKLITYENEPAILGVVTDVTQLKEAETLSTAILDNSPVGIYIIQDGKFKLVNPTFQKITGYKEEELLERYSLDMVFPEDQNSVRENAIKMLKGKRSSPYEFRCVRKGGEIRWSAEQITSMLYRGKRAILGSFMDITEFKRIEEEVQKGYVKLGKIVEGTIEAIASIAETRDPYTAGHQRRVSRLSTAIAEEMGLPKEQIATIRIASVLHDIGKINVPSEILSKPGKLDDMEMNIVKMHPQVAYEILKTLELPWSICPIVLQHHERMDGSGYPKGLSGDDITLEARILAVADVVEAMASHRPYRPALGKNKALEEIAKNKGILYDKKVVDACFRVFNKKGFELEE